MLKMRVWVIFLKFFIGRLDNNYYLCIVIRIKEQREDDS